MNLQLHPESVLFLTVDSCRFDSFKNAHTPHLKAIAPLHEAQAPSYFTYGSHAAFWMGFTPGITSAANVAWLNPKSGKLFRMNHSAASCHGKDAFELSGSNIIEGFRDLGYHTIGTGAVAWFDQNTPTGSVLAAPFDQFWYSGNTWNLRAQLSWLSQHMQRQEPNQPLFIFLNIGETHVPYWHEDADWEQWPSPCVPFGGKLCSRSESRRRQIACLEWVDSQLSPLLDAFNSCTILACADHGDCWGENGLWEHGVSHPSTLTVPLLMRVRGVPISV